MLFQLCRCNAKVGHQFFLFFIQKYANCNKMCDGSRFQVGGGVICVGLRCSVVALPHLIQREVSVSHGMTKSPSILSPSSRFPLPPSARCHNDSFCLDMMTRMRSPHKHEQIDLGKLTGECDAGHQQLLYRLAVKV